MEVNVQFEFTMLGTGIDIEADAAHPNKLRFRGVLVRLDEPSTKPPNGAHGHRIMVSSAVAQKAIGSLMHMGVNYAPSLDGHAQRRKVGVITKAWIDGKDLWVEGTIWKHDFPEAQTDLKQPGLGMSMEIGQVKVADADASVWNITDMTFLGATILYKRTAAYEKTQAIAAKAEQGGNAMKTSNTAQKKKATDGADAATSKLVRMAATAAASALAPVLQTQSEILAQQSKVLEGIQASFDDLEERVDRAIAAKKSSDDEEDGEDDGEDDEEMETGKACKAGAEDEVAAESDDEVDAEEQDEGDLDEMGEGAEGGDVNDEPGHFNEDSKNKGSKTTAESKVGPTVSSAAIADLKLRMKQLSRKFTAQLEANTQLRRQVKRLKTQVTAAASETNRRSVAPDVAGLLTKHGFDVNELRASGQKLPVETIDSILAGMGIESGKRAELKHKLWIAGLMEDGVVDRGFSRTTGRA